MKRKFRCLTPILDHTHPRDQRVSMVEATHTYTVQGWPKGKPIVSVSGLYKQYFTPFDAPATIRRMMNSRNWPNSKYHGLTASQIEAQWAEAGAEACRKGTAHHLLCEDYYNGRDTSKVNTPAFDQFRAFADDHAHLRPFRTEWMLFSDPSTRVCGTIDMLYFSPRRERGTLFLTMVDWKNAKQIKKTGFGGQQGTAPFDGLPDCNFVHYAIQLNTYKYLLETFYAPIVVDGVTYDKIEVDDMYLAVMHESQTEYQKLLLPDYGPRIKQMFAERKLKLSED